MSKVLIELILLSCLIIVFACKNESNNTSKTKTTVKEKNNISLSDLKTLYPLYGLLDNPLPGEWLYSQKESGQTFKEYINSQPICPYKNQNKIYIQPIGSFDKTDNYILRTLKEYITAFFGLETVLLESISDTIIPESSTRINNGIEQIHTKYILDYILLKDFPEDAIVFTAITSKDLYPRESWNFVFGQAYLKQRVGVSSIYRYKTDNQNKSFLLNRIMKTTSHELCHMFSLKHCINFKCIMNGSISLQEADSKPSWLCPSCLAKIIWCTKYDINTRYDSLISFSHKYNFKQKEVFYEQAKDMLNQ